MLFGLGRSVSHSLISFSSPLFNGELSEAHPLLVSHITTDLALQPQRLFLCRLSEFALKRIFLSAISMFLPFMATFTPGQSASLSSLVNGNCVRPLSLTFGAIGSDFLGRLHRVHLLIRYRTTDLNI
jgi:hypothetical protein